MNWKIKSFSELNIYELYAILKLRAKVFVVEQNCVFQDMDDKDQACQHLMLYQKKELMAYARIVPPGVIYAQPSIGRIVSSHAARGKGFGKQLLKLAIENTIRLHGNKAIKIGAQTYLKDFYGSFGFVSQDDPYIEDGIPHIHMIRPVF